MPTNFHKKIASYKRWQDKQASLFGKLLLLRALRQKFPDTWQRKFHSMELSPYGKPFIQDGPEFNISHSEEIVALALSKGGKLGIDVEKIRAIDIGDFSHYLPEVADLPANYDSAQATALFFDCWTQKEAVLKAYGKGLLEPLKQVVLRDGAALFQETRWFIKKLRLADDYCCQIAANLPLAQVTVEHVNPANDFMCLSP